MKELIDFVKGNKVFLIIGGVISFLYVLPLLQAGVLYQDDNARIFLGYGWDYPGRFFADTIMQGLSLGELITPILPYSLLLAAVITFFSGVIVSYTLFPNEGMITKISSLLFLTSPFFLENLSYQFDAVPMALSVFLALLPYLFLNRRCFFVISVVSLFLVFELYQTSAMIYPAMLACVLIKENREGKSIINIKLILVSGAAFIMAFLLFKMHLMYKGIQLDRSELIGFDLEALRAIFKRMEMFGRQYSKLFSHTAFLIIFALFFFLSVTVYLSFIFKSKENWIRALVILFCFLGVLVFSTLPDSVLQNPWYARPRAMVVYPFLLYALVCISVSNKSVLFSRLYSFSIGLIVFYSFVLSSHYGASLKNYDEYADFITSTVSYEIMKDNPKQQPIIVKAGAHPVPPKNILIYKKFPIIPGGKIEGLEANTLFNAAWASTYFSKYLGSDISIRWEAGRYERDKCDMEVLTKTPIYHLRKRDNVYVVDFDYKSCEGGLS